MKQKNNLFKDFFGILKGEKRFFILQYPISLLISVIVATVTLIFTKGWQDNVLYIYMTAAFIFFICTVIEELLTLIITFIYVAVYNKTNL